MNAAFLGLFCFFAPAQSLAHPTSLPTATETAAIHRAPEQRPMSAFPPGLRPFVKYGVGGGVALWFVGSLMWIARQKLRQAKTAEQRREIRRGIRRWFLNIGLAVALLALCVIASLKTRELLYLWIGTPVALLLPLLLHWKSRTSSVRGSD